MSEPAIQSQHDRQAWPEMKQQFTTIFKTKTREEWCELLEGTDVCFAPILSPWEAHEHPHLKSRGVFVKNGGVVQPGPAPRFSRTQPEIQGVPAIPGQHTREVLTGLGLYVSEIDELSKNGIVVNSARSDARS
jgi:alpha-methylacyl-CoA racemase